MTAQEKSLLEQVAPPVPMDTMGLGTPAVFKGTLRIKVSLDNVWRRFDVPSTATLEDLAWKILGAYRFENDHLFAFRVPSPTGEMLEYTHYAMDEGLPAAETTLGEVPFRVGQKSVFHYDFGADWEFEVLIESMEPRVSKSIKLIESEGKAPKQYESW